MNINFYIKPVTLKIYENIFNWSLDEIGVLFQINFAIIVWYWQVGFGLLLIVLTFYIFTCLNLCLLYWIGTRWNSQTKNIHVRMWHYLYFIYPFCPTKNTKFSVILLRWLVVFYDWIFTLQWPPSWSYK